MKNHISLFIFAIALLSGPVSANDLSMTAVKDTLASIPGEHNYIYVPVSYTHLTLPTT